MRFEHSAVSQWPRELTSTSQVLGGGTVQSLLAVAAGIPIAFRSCIAFGNNRSRHGISCLDALSAEDVQLFGL